MEQQPLIDQSLFQIIVLIISAGSAVLFALAKGSINNFTKSIKEGYDRHETRLNAQDEIAMNHEKRITENHKDIESNTAQDLLKSDTIARRMDDVQQSLKEMSADIRGIGTRLTDYIISQRA